MMNARIYIKIFMAILFLGMMPSCTYDTIHVNGLNEYANVTLTLALNDQALNVSRGGAEGTEGNEGTNTPNPETVINSVDLFFYGKDATETTDPIHVQKGLVPNTDGTISFSMPVDKFNRLFPNDETATCQVFAIVNRPAAPSTTVKYPKDTDNVLPADAEATVANLKNMVLYTDFVSTQKSFVMHSNGMVTINRTQTNGLNGTIPVKRVAAKIGFDLVYPTGKTQLEVIEGGAVKWTATSNDVRIKFCYGSKRTKLGSTLTSYSTDDIFSSADYINYADITAFYTYPTNWENAEIAHTHLMVEVTWTKYVEESTGESDTPAQQDGDDSSESLPTITTYYEISNLNPGFNSIEQNYWYRIQQSISVLGATTEDEAVELTPCYNVLPWGAAGLSGELNRNRYLAVDETNVIMNNIVTKKIKFASSDPIDLTEVEVLWHFAGQEEAKDVTLAERWYETKTNANGNEETETKLFGTISGTDGVYTITNTNAPIDKDGNTVTYTVNNQNRAIRIKDEASAVKITINNTKKYIEISHALDNSMTNGSDFTKYMINFTVQHQDNAKFKEKIQITQHPMISVEAEQNSDYVNSTSSGNSYGDGNNKHGGYLIINGYDGSESWRGTSWYTIGGWNNSWGLNHNPNRYIIKVSSLAGVNNYTIGDPRETEEWDVPEIINKDDNNKSLDYYYRTNPTVGVKMIAPEFMVASSYGYCNGDINDLATAERRCATYQEDGYPAGRWRVPTYAEVSYIIQLSGWGSIPELYSSGQWYWTAQGAVTYQNGGISNTSNSGKRVRCVYDTWYWGTDDRLKDDPSTNNVNEKMIYTYGDKQR